MIKTYTVHILKVWIVDGLECERHGANKIRRSIGFILEQNFVYREVYITPC